MALRSASLLAAEALSCAQVNGALMSAFLILWRFYADHPPKLRN